ncbi:MAG: dihydrodipicolinate synthase family protein [Stappiaceae bacterium]
MAQFEGVIPYLATPTSNAGEIDTQMMSRLCEHLIAKGVHGLCPLGSTGEFAYLSGSQKALTIETVIAAAAGRVPVIAGVAGTATQDAVAQAKTAKAAGADGILAVMEAYFPIDEKGVVAYFTAIADATDLPVTIYTNPNFQRSDLSLSAIERLSHHPNIVALKDASTNTGRLLSVINRMDGRLDVFAASAHITIAVMLIGGKGWMAGPSCLVPEKSVQLFELCKARNWDAAMILQRELWAINETFAKYNLAGAIKAGLRLQGLDCGDPIPPQASVSAQGVEEIRSVLEKLEAL